MLRILINGEEVVTSQNISIKEEFLSTSSFILNGVYPQSWEKNRDYTSNFYFPKDYSQCLIYFDEQLIFAGVVKNSGNISLNPRYPHTCDLQVLSYKTFLSEGNTLDFVIANKTVEEAIQMVVNAVAGYGFTVGTIDIAKKDDVIGAYSTLDKSAYDVLQYIADITNSKWYTSRVDDNTLTVNFYDSDKMAQAPDIKYTQEYWDANNIQDMSFSFSTNDYRNKQVMTSSAVYGNVEQTQTILSNGYDKTYLTEQKIGTINSITVDGTPATFATSNEKDLGITADFYYTVNNNQFEANTVYTAGTEIEISYIPIVQGREVIINPTEINRINTQLGINGNISRYEQRNDATSSSELQSIGQSYIQFKGKAEITLTIQTYGNDLFQIGQQAQFNAPIKELSDSYMVKSKTIDIIQVNEERYLFYTYTLSNNFNAETAINYFDNQRSKANGNISQGEYIARNVDIENTALIIFDNAELIEVEMGDNVLNAPLNAPFTQ